MKPSTGTLFEDLVRRILEQQSFTVTQPSHRGAGFDYIAERSNVRWAIEVKFYRTVRAQPNLIEAAATRLVSSAVGPSAMRGMLVVSCILPTELREALEEQSGVMLVDRLDLRLWASSAPALAEELEALVEANPSEPSAATDKSRIERLALEWMSVAWPRRTTRPNDTRGTELCRDLRAVKRGRAGWARYEEVCAEVLKYLFPNDLLGWHAQKRTDDGLNRFDFVCRVRPTTEFWKFVIDHIDSRYVLFEFKNYTAKIKQGQILTTEKYLFERGLRRVALVFSRAGADENALQMARGAMREHGKLIVIVNDEQVCDMLHMKERGEDPTDYLFELVDDFLLTLSR